MLVWFLLVTYIFILNLSLGVHALNDWKNEILNIIDIRIDNFTKHPYLYHSHIVAQSSQKHTSVLWTNQDTNKEYDSYKCLTCNEFCEEFTFLTENIYVQFEDRVYQQIVGIPIGTNCTPLIADVFLYCYDNDFMPAPHKSKTLDLFDNFNDTSRYPDDILTIDYPKFEQHISEI